MDNWWKRNITTPVIVRLGKRKVKKLFTKGPILIGGCGRSGTSLLLSMLSSHPKILALPKESDAFTKWTRDNMGEVLPERIDRFYRQIYFLKVSKTQDRWCEKRPYNVRYIPQILEYFGKRTRFVHIVRDPRAVCTSSHPSRPQKYWVSPERYFNDVSAGLRYKDHKQVYTLRYEDLITDTPKQLTQLCEFLKLDYTPEIQNWFEHATVRSNKAWVNPLQNTYVHSLEKWKSEVHQERVQEVVNHQGINEVADNLGYDLH